MRRHIAIVCTAIMNFSPATASEWSNCFANEMTEASWKQQIESSFSTAQLPLSDLITQLQSCLYSPKSAIRDDIGYMGMATLLRSGQVQDELLQQTFEGLLSDINLGKKTDEQVFIPFAILVLSEVVRVDRVTPYLDAQQRENVIHVIDSHLKQLDDYRGYNYQTGWRHHVAHSADVFLQLALNDQVTDSQLKQIGQIILRTTLPNSHHFFHFNEPKRLARAMLYLIMRKEVELTFWKTVLAETAKPKEFVSWADTYQSEEGLAQQHNRYAFFSALTSYISYQDDPRLRELAPLVAKLTRGIG